MGKGDVFGYLQMPWLLVLREPEPVHAAARVPLWWVQSGCKQIMFLPRGVAILTKY